MTTEYSIGKHRFYELRHFCLQYPEWKALYSTLDGWGTESGINEGDTTSRDGIRRADLKRNMEMIEETCRDIGGEYTEMLLSYVTTGGKLRLKASQKDFWLYYRKFFWVLSGKRG